jgi:GMP synthase-like glutamine amidotransferase
MIIEGNDIEHIYTSIYQSTITHWVCSGAEYSVHEPSSPRLPIDILLLPLKRFLFICFSMQSILHQLGNTVYCAPDKIQGLFRLSDSLLVYRNHYCYVTNVHSDQTHYLDIVHSIIDMDGIRKVMTVYLNSTSILLQWHPEKTINGYVFFKDWLQKKEI